MLLSTNNPWKRAFERYKPRGLFSEFYGIIENRSFYQSSRSLGWVVIDIFIGGAGSRFVSLDNS